jgi:cytochrome c553
MRATSGRTSMLNATVATSAMLAATGSAVAQTGDLELGRYLASECVTCHRSATASSIIPNIFGMSVPRFVMLIKAYRDKQMPNPVMQSVASRLKDEDIEALALYFSVTKKP